MNQKLNFNQKLASLFIILLYILKLTRIQMFNTQGQTSSQGSQLNQLKKQIDTSIKLFINQIKNFYSEYQRRTSSQLASQNHLNRLTTKELYKILTIMVQPNPQISMKNQNQSKSFNYFNYEEDQMEAQFQLDDCEIKEEHHEREEQQIDEESQSQGDESQSKKDQRLAEKKKNKKKKNMSHQKKIQYYTTTQQQQKLIIDACTKYYMEKKNLTKSQISMIARRIVGNQIFKASNNWVKRLLIRIPLLNRYVLGKEPISNIKQTTVNSKPIVKSEVIQKEENYQQYFWNQEEILQNIKKAFRERSNK